MNRTDQLKAAIMQALDSPDGVIYSVTGTEASRRQLAVSALISAKRELLPDVPDVINIHIRPVPGEPDQIAIIKIRPQELLDV